MASRNSSIENCSEFKICSAKKLRVKEHRFAVRVGYGQRAAFCTAVGLLVMLQIAAIVLNAALFGRGQAAFRFRSGMTSRAKRSMPSIMG